MKTFTQILAFVLIATGLTAQMSVGVKTGITVNQYGQSQVLNDDFDTPASLGYTLGASLDIPFGGRMGLETGAYWTRKGSNIESENVVYQFSNSNGTIDIYTEGTEKLNYLTIPAHLKVFFRGKTIGSYLMIGPEFNFALSGKYSINYVDTDGAIVKEAEDVLNSNGVESNGDIEFGSGRSDDYGSFDFGIGMGGGLYYELEVGRITFDARYYFGMSNLLNTEDDDLKLKNKNLIVQIGYAFPIGGAW